LDNKTKEGYKQTLEEEIDKLTKKSGRLSLVPGKVDEVFTHYENYEEIMQKHMKKDNGVIKKDDILDHHKIAAAFCCSVMKARPIDYSPDNSGNATPLEDTANEQCAFLFGLQVVQNFREAKTKENIPPREKDIYSKRIMLPDPNKNTVYSVCFENLLSMDAFKRFDYGDKKFGETLIFFIAHIYLDVYLKKQGNLFLIFI